MVSFFIHENLEISFGPQKGPTYPSTSEYERGIA